MCIVQYTFPWFIPYTLIVYMYFPCDSTAIFVCLIDSLCPINNLSVKQGWVFLGLTSTKLGQMCLAHGPQRSDAGEARTKDLSVLIQG